MDWAPFAYRRSLDLAALFFLFVPRLHPSGILRLLFLDPAPAREAIRLFARKRVVAPRLRRCLETESSSKRYVCSFRTVSVSVNSNKPPRPSQHMEDRYGPTVSCTRNSFRLVLLALTSSPSYRKRKRRKPNLLDRVTRHEDSPNRKRAGRNIPFSRGTQYQIPCLLHRLDMMKKWVLAKSFFLFHFRIRLLAMRAQRALCNSTACTSS